MRDWSSGRDAAASATAFKLEFHKTLATSVHASYDTGTTWETYSYKILIFQSDILKIFIDIVRLSLYS